jgi:hypothetical protein
VQGSGWKVLSVVRFTYPQLLALVDLYDFVRDPPVHLVQIITVGAKFVVLGLLVAVLERSTSLGLEFVRNHGAGFI